MHTGGSAFNYSLRPEIEPTNRVKKAQDRADGEEIANNSVLKIRMKNAVLRKQAALAAQPDPKPPFYPA
jgi:hypothetical protein